MGRQKLLLPYLGRPLIKHVTDALRGAGTLAEVIVVAGHDHQTLKAEVGDDSIRWFRNPSPETGMLDSVRLALAATSAVDAFMIALGDQPRITPSIIAKLTDRFHQEPQPGILVPRFGGTRGHPLVIADRFRDEIMTCHDKIGLRGLRLAHLDEVRFLDFEDARIAEDIDTPEAYERLCSDP